MKKALLLTFWLTITGAGFAQFQAGNTSCGAAPGSAKPDLAILYTGRLLGYLRDDPSANYVTVPFRASLVEARQYCPNQIFIGMGDNFAPEYGARFVNGVPKPRDGSDLRTDDVINLLLSVHYDALVPGKEDFYFGPEYLRLAGNLPGLLPILGANLVIRTDTDTPPRPPNITGYVDTYAGFEWLNQARVLPWQRDFKFRIKHRIVADLIKESGDKTKHFEDLVEISLCSFLTDYATSFPDSGCKPLVPHLERDHSTEEMDDSPLMYSLKLESPSSSEALPSEEKDWPLSPLRAYGICMAGLRKPLNIDDSDWNAAKGRYCHVFHVERPMFNRGWVMADGGKVAIFGVVDPKLIGLLAPENKSWADAHGYHFNVATLSPDVVLAALRSSFDQIHPHFEGKKVLLAQMSHAEAEELAAHIDDFDIVFSRADYRHATGEIMIEHPVRQRSTSSLTQNTSKLPSRAVIITPRPIYVPDPHECPVDSTLAKQKAEACLIQPLQALTVTETPDPMSQTRVRSLKNHVSAKAVGSDQNPSIQDLLNVAASLNSSQSQRGTGSNFEQFTVNRLRERLHADVALLQKHDFFFGAFFNLPLFTLHPQEILDRVVWRAGFVTRVYLTGDKLKSVLDESKKIEELESSSTSVLETTENGLVRSGIDLIGDAYYVNGEKLDSSRTYTIATSQALLSDDSGYPELKQDVIGDPQIFLNSGATPITSVLCNALKQSVPDLKNSACLPEVPRNAVIIAGSPSWVPADAPPSPHIWSETLKWVGNLRRRQDIFAGVDPTELQIHRRTIWSLAVPKLEGTFNFSKPNLTDKSVKSAFGGVTNPDVVQAHTEKYTIVEQLRAVRSGKYFNYGAEEDLAFGRSRQGNFDGSADSVTLTDNHVTFGPVFELHRHRYDPKWRVEFRPADSTSVVSNK